MAPPAALFLVMAWNRRWNTDDAFINFRILDQIAAGNGPVFNAGERVESATSTLWLLLLGTMRVLTFGLVSLEWLSIVLGLGLSALFVALGLAADRRLWGARPRAVFVPMGLLVVAALSPMWDFATSGLETSLSFAWLALSFWILVTLAGRDEDERVLRHRHLLAGFVVGLGPLVRPDLAVFSLGLGLGLGAVLGWRRAPLLRAAAAAVGLPVLYQVFRMGYYATLGPNTALAKSASEAWWTRGWFYLGDFVSTYRLLLPLAVVAVVLGGLLADLWGRVRSTFWVVVAMEGSALVHGLYVVRLGGDYMHARLLLPALAGVLLPVLAAPVELGTLRTAVARLATRVGVLAVVVVPWALVAATSLRWSLTFDNTMIWHIQNERTFWSDLTNSDHPVTLQDYRGMDFGYVQLAESIRHREAAGERFVFLSEVVEDQNTFVPLADGPQVVAGFGNVGAFGYEAGVHVFIADYLSLGDPYASRMEVVARGIVGHEKDLPKVWYVARLSSSTPFPEVTVARQALSCGDLAELKEETTGDLTPGRFLKNIVDSPSLTRLSLPPDPSAAERKFC